MRSSDQIAADARDKSPFSNHTEFEMWAGRYCYECVNDDAETETWCPILGVALFGQWPKEWIPRTHEWQIGDKSGSYEVVDTCTEFEQRRDDGPDGEPDPGPGPFDEEMPGQTDIFTFIVEDALDDLPQPERVTA